MFVYINEKKNNIYMYFKFILILDIYEILIFRCSDFYKSNDYIFFVVWMKNY